ncbi:hypothetical protein SBOR_6581 [Sclerotinia borealis F-4128]|uniref:Serine hydrolase domain-containing protein n=1 Tax=Sclerotinia borealis (strain F-4128) TaxID=1432307 RepID=W9CEM7_SCLBF|nr:hypothetical protein SBOR_6581 [Sclerotinia borealis F-4128]
MSIKETLITSGRDLKILCLHGIGTNSDVCYSSSRLLYVIQYLFVSSFRYYLGDGYQYDFVDGGHLWPAAPGIVETFGPQQVCYSYSDGTALGSITAVDDLAAYIIENGPFDSILGFSMGTALAATLLLRPKGDLEDSHTHACARRMIRSAVFVCGTLPVDRNELAKGKMGWLVASQVEASPAAVWPTIDIPTVHAWSPQDEEYPGQSEELICMCSEKTRIEVLHGAKHGFPSKAQEVAELVTIAKEMFARLGHN